MGKIPYGVKLGKKEREKDRCLLQAGSADERLLVDSGSSYLTYSYINIQPVKILLTTCATMQCCLTNSFCNV